MKNVLGSLFLWFYRLDMTDAALLILVLTVFFLMIHSRLSDKRWWKCLIGVALVCLLCVIAYSTVLMRDGGDVYQHNFIPFHSYREVWDGGNSEIYRSNFMNALLFYPAGLLGALLLPRKWAGWCRCILVVLALTAMSAGIEFLQYRYALGRCEIDDVIHNTAGALIGCLAALWMPKLLAYLKDKMRSKAASDA